jgi:hypothetical protein
MSYLVSSPVTLNSIPLQVTEGGFSIGALSTVDKTEDWLSRSKLAALRDENDALGFDMVNISGTRMRIDYIGTGHAVPMNNELVLNSLYKKVLRRKIGISGSTMNGADYASFLTANDLAQQYWAKRAQLLAQIADADTPFIKVQALVVEYAALVAPVISLSSPFVTSDVTFDEGDSCSFTSYIDNIVTDFKFNLLYDVALT